LTSYNEFPINQYEYSIDTHIPYVHYWFTVPQVKISGNYMLAVYRASDKTDLILSKRFMVYDNRVTFLNEQNLIGAGNVASVNQQINFTVNYKDVEILNPMESVSVSIRQNQRWDNVATNVKPSFIRELQHELEYRFFDDRKMFKGNNEFRFFDLRSINYPGRNIATVDKMKKPFTAYVVTDKTRSHEAYAQYQDLNGNFIIDNLDYSNESAANYLNVVFTLQSPRTVGDGVYVTGAFNYWNLNRDNLMQYDSSKQVYTASMLLKQGWYDYQYVVSDKKAPSYSLEGTHYETENFYEIFVYYRPFQPRADLLIGYLKFYMNPRH
jgi:Domain of unknown function (DUF5103)